VLDCLPAEFALPVIVAQHLHPTHGSCLADLLCARCALPVRESEDKDTIEPGTVYVAPPNYHLLVENEETLTLSVDGKVNYSRPSIDVLFESAADVWGRSVVGVLLTGANRDGADGLRHIRDQGGLTIAQTPASAEQPVMPQAAIDAGAVDRALSLDEIGRLLAEIGSETGRNNLRREV